MTKLEPMAKKKGGTLVKVANLLVALAVVAGVATFFLKKEEEKPAPPTMEQRVNAASAAIALEPGKTASPEELQAARARITAKTTPVQAELKALYDELLVMRGTPAFANLGFSANNKPAADWKIRVESLRSRIEKDEDIVIQVRAAPAYLLTLGLDKEWRKGGMTDKAKWDTEMIRDAINWKMGE